jgi:hypothetical protein
MNAWNARASSSDSGFSRTLTVMHHDAAVRVVAGDDVPVSLGRVTDLMVHSIGKHLKSDTAVV